MKRILWKILKNKKTLMLIGISFSLETTAIILVHNDKNNSKKNILADQGSFEVKVEEDSKPKEKPQKLKID